MTTFWSFYYLFLLFLELMYLFQELNMLELGFAKDKFIQIPKDP